MYILLLVLYSPPPNFLPWGKKTSFFLNKLVKFTVFIFSKITTKSTHSDIISIHCSWHGVDKCWFIRIYVAINFISLLFLFLSLTHNFTVRFGNMRFLYISFSMWIAFFFLSILNSLCIHEVFDLSSFSHSLIKAISIICLLLWIWISLSLDSQSTFPF